LERGSGLGYSIGMDIEAKGTGPLFEAAEAVGRAAVESVDPGRLIIKNVFRVAAGASGKDAVTIQGKTFDLGEHDRVFLAAFGKAAEAMAGAMADILGDRLAKGRRRLAGRRERDARPARIHQRLTSPPRRRQRRGRPPRPRPGQ
jgi:hypothetical protein